MDASVPTRKKAPEPVLWFGDCMERMKQIPDGSVDAVINDPPFGVTANEWDQVLPLDALWAEYDRILKPNGVVVLFACGGQSDEPFLGKLIMSNPKMFRYSMVYPKVNSTMGTHARHRPLRIHEDILVFYRGQCTYNPVMVEKKTRVSVNLGMTGATEERFPTTILPTFARDIVPTGEGHPTQKPVKLMEWLIKTYTNRFEVVLDNTMGSGTTGVACVHLDRGFIGIESDRKYFDLAHKRISRAQSGVQVEVEQKHVDLSALLPPLQKTFDVETFMKFHDKLHEHSSDEGAIYDALVTLLNRYFKIIHEPSYQVLEVTYDLHADRSNPKSFVTGHVARTEAQIKKRLQKCQVWSDAENKTISVYDVWSKHRQSEEYGTMIFSPPTAPKDGDQPMENWNTFYSLDAQLRHELGTGATGTDEGMAVIMNHCSALAGNNADMFNYLLDWLAYPIQTGKKTEVALIVKGKQGCGKNLFFSELVGKRIYGMKYYTEVAGGHQLSAQFNAHLSSKMFLVVDEPNKLSVNQRNLLKNAITSSKKEVQAKYQDAVIMDDFTNFAFTCNAVPDDLLEYDDRRFFVIQHSGENVQDLEYSTRLVQAIEACDLNFYYFLLNRKIEVFKPGQAPPQTEIKRSLRYQAIDPVFRYFRHLLDLYQSDSYTWKKYQRVPEFFDDLVKWCKDQRIKPGWKDSLEVRKILQHKFENHTWESPRKPLGRCIIFPEAAILQEWLISADLYYTENDEIVELEKCQRAQEELNELQASQTPDPRVVDSDFRAERMSQWLSEAQGSWKEPTTNASISAPKLVSMPTFRSPKPQAESEDTEDSRSIASSLNRQMDELAGRATKIHIAESPQSLGLRENEKPLPPQLDQYGTFNPNPPYAGSLPPSETGFTDYGDYSDLDAMIKVSEEKRRKQRSGDDTWDKE